MTGFLWSLSDRFPGSVRDHPFRSQQLTVLLNSRNVLAVYGEWSRSLVPLEHPDYDLNDIRYGARDYV